MFIPLKPEDIEEKIQLNLKDGHDLITLKDALEAELHQEERIILTHKTQSQNLREQISYIDKRIAGRVDPALIEGVTQSIEAAAKSIAKEL